MATSIVHNEDAAPVFTRKTLEDGELRLCKIGNRTE
jgi:hypothetical protein